jgi:hypothetical protein
MQISVADQKQIAPASRATRKYPKVRVAGNPRIDDTRAFVELQLILEKAAAPNQLLIATSSTMGGFWS